MTKFYVICLIVAVAGYLAGLNRADEEPARMEIAFSLDVPQGACPPVFTLKGDARHWTVQNVRVSDVDFKGEMVSSEVPRDGE